MGLREARFARMDVRSSAAAGGHRVGAQELSGDIPFQCWKAAPRAAAPGPRRVVPDSESVTGSQTVTSVVWVMGCYLFAACG